MSERHSCAFCEGDYKDKKYRNKHENKKHPLEVEQRKQIKQPCLECDSPVSYGKLFCSPSCRQRAKAIRYIRSVRKRKVEKRFDIKRAISEKIMWAHMGGYEGLDPKIRKQVLLRDNFTCVSCNTHYNQFYPDEPSMTQEELEVRVKDFPSIFSMLEVDHINGRSHELENLQLLCCRCHTKKTQSNRKPINEKTDKKYLEYINNIYQDVDNSVKPQHTPDWDWRHLRSQRMRNPKTSNL